MEKKNNYQPPKIMLETFENEGMIASSTKVVAVDPIKAEWQEETIDAEFVWGE